MNTSSGRNKATYFHENISTHGMRLATIFSHLIDLSAIILSWRSASGCMPRRSPPNQATSSMPSFPLPNPHAQLPARQQDSARQSSHTIRVPEITAPVPYLCHGSLKARSCGLHCVSEFWGGKMHFGERCRETDWGGGVGGGLRGFGER